MDMRPFELANEACKPKHFGPPSQLQRRLRAEAAYHQVWQPSGRSLVRWLRAALSRVRRKTD
jgi:hypothetical protein